VTTETTAGSAAQPAADTDIDPEAAAKASTLAALTNRLAGLTAGEQIALLTDLVVAEAGIARTEQNPDESFEREIDGDSPLFEVGFNSLSAVELRNRLAAATGLTLSPMLLFDHPTPALAAEFLREQLAAE
jgi:acyl carrier protein